MSDEDRVTEPLAPAEAPAPAAQPEPVAQQPVLVEAALVAPAPEPVEHAAQKLEPVVSERAFEPADSTDAAGQDDLAPAPKHASLKPAKAPDAPTEAEALSAGEDAGEDAPAAPKKPKASARKRRKQRPAEEAPAAPEQPLPASEAAQPAASEQPVSNEGSRRRTRRHRGTDAARQEGDATAAAPEEPAEPPAAQEQLAADAAPAGQEDAPAGPEPAEEQAQPKPEGSSRSGHKNRAPSKPIEEMSLDELTALFTRRRRGRPSKKDLQMRAAAEATRENPTPEAIAQLRAMALAAFGGPVTVKPAPVQPKPADGTEQPVSAEPAGEQPVSEQGEPAEGGYGQRRRHHERAQDRPEKGERPWKKEQGSASRRERDRQREGRDAKDAPRERAFDQQRPQRDGKPVGEGQQQFGKNGRKNGRRDYAAELPSREELEELTVGDLRAKAAEYGADTAGLKKPELIDIVYSGMVKDEGFFEFEGVFELANEGFGHVRTKGYLPSAHDIYVGVAAVRANGLRRGDYVAGIAHRGRPTDKFPGVAKITAINGRDPEGARNRPRFGDLTPVFPSEALKMEHGKDSILGRCIDLVAPIGKGQRGLIVSPPKAGKTTVLKKIAESIAANNPEVHLICLLVDERPEEVTDMQRSIKGEVVASTFDMPCDNHIAVSELVIERAKRLVEQGEDVVILLDSITRLARAYNLAQPASGRILSGGVDSTALYPPKRFLGAARNIEDGGSLTILASALVDTGSKMDEVIFEEFKGTGNMELKLDRELADRRIFPAIDPVASGTRKEELLLSPDIAPFVWGVRRILANMNNNERAMTQLIRSLKATNTNEEFLVRSARKAQMQESNEL